MATTTIYSTEGTDGSIQSKNADYVTARQVGTLTVSTAATTATVGQNWDVTNKYSCMEVFLAFDASGVTGMVTAATLTLTVDTIADLGHEFTLNVRSNDYGATLTDADWIAGPDLYAKTLRGTKASSAMIDATAFATTLTHLQGKMAPDAVPLTLSSSRLEAGAIPTMMAGSFNEFVVLRSADYTGTTSDPKLVLVDDADKPEDVTVTDPLPGNGYTGIIALSGSAADPNADDVRLHWDYSINGGTDWTACPNSPSGYVDSGTAATIQFDMSAFAYGFVNLRTRAFDGTNYSTNYVQTDILNAPQSGFALYRTAGADFVGDPVSGLQLTRPMSTPSTLSFSVDNFDAGEAGITDSDELILTIGSDTGTSIYWRGFVQEKRVGEIMEVQAADVSYRFPRLRVTQKLLGQTVGSIVKAIVENPTGAEATGITATCAEVVDPLASPAYLSIASFDGQNRSVAEWLGELAEMTGCAWYVYHDETTWQFVWYDPSANAAWAVACKDNIDYGAESTTQARIINTPTVNKDRKGYVNRVWYWRDQRQDSTADASKDATYTEATTPWTVIDSDAAVSQEGTTKTTGTYSIEFADASCAPNTRHAYMLTLAAGDYDWTPAVNRYVKFDYYFESDGTITRPTGQLDNLILVSGSKAPTGVADLSWQSADRPDGWRGCYFRADRMPVEDTWIAYESDTRQAEVVDSGGFDLTDVRWIIIVTNVGADSTGTWTAYIDNFHWGIEPMDISVGGPSWELAKVETAAVTADTEAPIETILSTRLVDRTAAASLAQAYLDAYAKTRITVEDAQLFGMRDLTLDHDVTLTLASRGITATAYPLTSITYSFLETGHTTSLSMGDKALTGQAALERLMRRLQDVTAEVRA